jgi:hypothetical protein
MTSILKTRAFGALFAAAVVLPLAACGEDNSEAVGDTALPNASEEQLIQDIDPAPEVESDPTPQATTGGEIPSYEPVDKGEGVPIEDDASPEATTPENRTQPDLENAPAVAPDPLPEADPATPAPLPQAQ